MVTPVGNRPPDPWLVFRFKVEIKDIAERDAALSFSKCGPLGVDGPPDMVKQGGSNDADDQLPPLRWKWKPVTLNRGMAKDGAPLWKWLLDTMTKRRIEPHNVTITMVDPNNKPCLTVTFIGAYPTNWSISPFDAGSGGLVVETIQFAHQGATIEFAGQEKSAVIGAPPPTPPAKPATPAKPGAPNSNQKPANPAPPPANKNKSANAGKPAGENQDSGRGRTEYVEEQSEIGGNAAPAQVGETGGTTAGEAVDAARDQDSGSS